MWVDESQIEMQPLADCMRSAKKLYCNYCIFTCAMQIICRYFASPGLHYASIRLKPNANIVKIVMFTLGYSDYLSV